MNQKESIKKSLYRAMSQMYDNKKSYISDVTFSATIVEVLDNYKYNIRLNDVIYQTYSCNELTYKVNDVVLVTVPQGQFSNMFIIGKRR